MWEMGASAEPTAAATLVVLSFVCFIAGAVFRRWPDKVREVFETIDGSIFVMTEEAHRTLITMSARVMTLLSVATLLAAAAVL